MATPVSAHDIISRFLERKEPRKAAKFADGSELASITLGGRKFLAFTPPDDMPTLVEEGNTGVLEKVMCLKMAAGKLVDRPVEPTMVEVAEGIHVPENIVHGRF